MRDLAGAPVTKSWPGSRSGGSGNPFPFSLSESYMGLHIRGGRGTRRIQNIFSHLWGKDWVS